MRRGHKTSSDSVGQGNSPPVIGQGDTGLITPSNHDLTEKGKKLINHCVVCRLHSVLIRIGSGFLRIFTIFVACFLIHLPTNAFAQDDGIDMDFAVRLGAGMPNDGSLSTYEGTGPWIGADIIVWFSDRYGISLSSDIGFMSAIEKDSYWINRESSYPNKERYRGLTINCNSLNALWRSNDGNSRKYYYLGGGLTYIEGTMKSYVLVKGLGIVFKPSTVQHIFVENRNTTVGINALAGIRNKYFFLESRYSFASTSLPDFGNVNFGGITFCAGLIW